MHAFVSSNRLVGTAIALLLSPSFASAIEWAVQPRIETGLQLYEFEQGAVTKTTTEGAFLRICCSLDDDGNLQLEDIPTEGTVNQNVSVSSKKIDDTLWTLSGGVTVFADRFFLDLSAQGAFDGSGSDNITETFNLPTSWNQTGEQQVNRSKTNADLEREEYSVSLGYAVTDRFSAFGGWKWSKTKFDEKRTGTFDIEQEILGFQGGFFSFGGTFQDDIAYDFEQSGPFLGAAYGWSFDGGGVLKGTLVANFALAFLDGEFKDVKRTQKGFKIDRLTVNGQEAKFTPEGERVFKEKAENRFQEVSSEPFFDGSTVGATIGVAWKGATKVEGLSYLLGVNAYSYNFDADNRTGVSGGDVTETVINFRAGLAYLF